jgi:hypothetical protein
MQDIIITTSTGETRGTINAENMKQWWLGKQLSGHRGIWLEHGGENLVQRYVPCSGVALDHKLASGTGKLWYFASACSSSRQSLVYGALNLTPFECSIEHRTFICSFMR